MYYIYINILYIYVFVEIGGLQCGHCDKVLSCKRSLKRHVIAMHQDEPPIKCSLCPKTFIEEYYRQQHMRAKHMGLKLVCPEDDCDKSYTTQGNLNSHMNQMHRNNFSYYCNFCGRAFVHLSVLNDHENQHRGIKPYKCPKCQKSFVKTSVCVRHQNTCGLKKGAFLCNGCGKSFKEARYLREHEKTHCIDGVKEWKCPICDKVYSHRASLYKHRKTH